MLTVRGKNLSVSETAVGLELNGNGMVVTFHQSKNGTESQATGTDISSWVSYDSTKGATFSVAGAASYRTASASKAIPFFDVMDYGQEDYVFGSAKADARHWSRYVLDVFEANKDTLAPLFNKSN